MAWSCAADRALAPQARHPPARAKRPRGGLLVHTCSISHTGALWREMARGPSSVTIRPARGIPRNARRTRHRLLERRARPTRACIYVGGQPDHVVARAYCFDATLHRGKKERVYMCVCVKLGKENWERHVMRGEKRNGRWKCKETHVWSG